MCDILIVGGGISGLYAAYKLIKYNDLKVTLIEKSDRFGGKIETIYSHGINIEMGPMRFEKSSQPLFNTLLEELQENVIGTYMFESNVIGTYMYESNNQDTNMYDIYLDETGITGKRVNALELMTIAILRLLDIIDGTTFNLNGIKDIKDPINIQKLSTVCNEEYYIFLKNNAMMDGVLLRNIGILNALNRVLSVSSIRFIIEKSTFFLQIQENVSVVQIMLFFLRGLKPNEEFITIRNGTESVIRKLEERITDSSHITLNKHMELISINKIKGNNSNRVLVDGKIVEIVSKRTILTIPPNCLNRISIQFPTHIREKIDSVLPYTLLKCAFLTQNPWWDHSTCPHKRINHILSREVHYRYYEIDGKALGLIMIYTDKPYSLFWENYIKEPTKSRSELNNNPKLLSECYFKFLSINPLETTNDIVLYAIREFSEKNLCIYLHKVGCDIDSLMTYMSSFSIDNTTNTVHICGDTFSDYSGFIEGSLKTVDIVIKNIISDKI